MASDATVFAEADLDAALEAGAAAADGIFFVPGDAHHHRPVDLARHVRRDRHFGIGRALGAEAAAAIFCHVHEVLRLNAAIAREARNHIGLALRGAEQEHLAVLPIGHGGTRLHAVVALRADDEAFVEHQLGVLEAGVEIAIGPFVGRLAHRQLVVARHGEVARRPLDGLELDARIGDVAVKPRIRPAGVQAVERIDHERQRLVFDLDQVDRVLGELFGFGGDRKDRLAHEVRLVGEDRILRRREGRHVLGGEDAEHALELERRGSVDLLDLGVRHRAAQEAAEHHAVGPIVFRVLRLPGHLAVDVGRGEILADEIICHVTPPERRASPH